MFRTNVSECLFSTTICKEECDLCTARKVSSNAILVSYKIKINLLGPLGSLITEKKKNLDSDRIGQMIGSVAVKKSVEKLW